MNGILLANKPKGFTSHDVVAKMRGILKTKKIGHAGTLDPMATGVLPLFVGKATKAVDMIPDQSKCYRATFRLGLETDTQDITGEVIKEALVDINSKDVEKALEGFRGEIFQIPPMYSAVQINGKRLYDLARQGKVVERNPRPVTIHRLELISWEHNDYTIDVHCSKGTYIRTICHDIGQRLGIGATLTELCRTKAGGYSIKDCLTIEEMTQHMNNGVINEYILSVESIFGDLQSLSLTEKQTGHFCNGVRMSTGQFGLVAKNQLLKIYDHNGIFIGVGKTREDIEMLISEKLFVQEVVF